MPSEESGLVLFFLHMKSMAQPSAATQTYHSKDPIRYGPFCLSEGSLQVFFAADSSPDVRRCRRPHGGLTPGRQTYLVSWVHRSRSQRDLRLHRKGLLTEQAQSQSLASHIPQALRLRLSFYERPPGIPSKYHRTVLRKEESLLLLNP